MMLSSFETCYIFNSWIFIWFFSLKNKFYHFIDNLYLLGYCSLTFFELFRWCSLNISVVANFKVFSQEIWAFLEIVSTDCFLVHAQAIITCSSVCPIRNLLYYIMGSSGNQIPHGPSSGFHVAVILVTSPDCLYNTYIPCCVQLLKSLLTNGWTDFLKCLKPPAFVGCCV